MNDQTDPTINLIRARRRVTGVEDRPKQSGRWDVVILNDDYTPMEFVVNVLLRHFGHSEDQAVLIMLQVHRSGRGCAGTFSRDVAETKAGIVMTEAQSEQHPLQVVIRKHQ